MSYITSYGLLTLHGAAFWCLPVPFPRQTNESFRFGPDTTTFERVPAPSITCFACALAPAVGAWHKADRVIIAELVANEKIA